MITRCENCGGIVAIQLEGKWKVDYCYRPYCAYGEDSE